MVSPQIVRGLLLAALCASCSAQYPVDYDASYDGYRVEEYEEPRSAFHDDIPAASVERAAPAAIQAHIPVFPGSDTSSYHLYHRDPHTHVELTDTPQYEAPKQDHKHHHSHDHGTSSMSFYQKVKNHDYKFKLEQKHGKKHGSFHGYAHPYAYGGLKVHDF